MHDQNFLHIGIMGCPHSDGSGVKREFHAPFCEGLRVKIPRSTHLRVLPSNHHEIRG